MVVAVGRAALGDNTGEWGSAVSTSVSSLARTFLTEADTVLGAAMGSDAALGRGRFLNVSLKDGSSSDDTLATVTAFAFPTSNAVASAVDAHTVLFTVSPTLYSFFAGRAGEARRAEAFTVETLTTRRFDHLPIDGDVMRLARGRAGVVNLGGAVSTTETIEAEALAQVADTVLGAVARAVGSFKSNDTAIFTFVTRLAGADTTHTDTVVVARTLSTGASLGLSAVGAFEPREAFAFTLDTNTLRGIALAATTRLTLGSSSAGLTETLVEFADTFAVAIVSFAKSNFLGAVSTFIAIETEATAVAAETVVGAVTGAGVVDYHSLALSTIETSVTHALAEVADTSEHAIVLAHVLSTAVLA